MALAANDHRHGTRNGYRNHGCRCAPCTAANTEELARHRATRSERLRANPSLPVKHGTVSTYTNWGCRCPRCREAIRLHYHSKATA